MISLIVFIDISMTPKLLFSLQGFIIITHLAFQIVSELASVSPPSWPLWPLTPPLTSLSMYVLLWAYLPSVERNDAHLGALLWGFKEKMSGNNNRQRGTSRIFSSNFISPFPLYLLYSVNVIPLALASPHDYQREYLDMYRQARISPHFHDVWASMSPLWGEGAGWWSRGRGKVSLHSFQWPEWRRAGTSSPVSLRFMCCSHPLTFLSVPCAISSLDSPF